MRRRTKVAGWLAVGLLAIACGPEPTGEGAVERNNPRPAAAPVGVVTITLHSNASNLNVGIQVNDKVRPGQMERFMNERVSLLVDFWDAEIKYDAGAKFIVVVTATVTAGRISKWVSGEIWDSQVRGGAVKSTGKVDVKSGQRTITMRYERG